MKITFFKNNEKSSKGKILFYCVLKTQSIKSIHWAGHEVFSVFLSSIEKRQTLLESVPPAEGKPGPKGRHVGELWDDTQTEESCFTF